jgi:hypothetical protein
MCHDIVRRFTIRGDLRYAHSNGRPQILDERVDRLVLRLLHDPSNDTTTIMGRFYISYLSLLFMIVMHYRHLGFRSYIFIHIIMLSKMPKSVIS